MGRVERGELEQYSLHACRGRRSKEEVEGGRPADTDGKVHTAGTALRNSCIGQQPLTVRKKARVQEESAVCSGLVGGGKGLDLKGISAIHWTGRVTVREIGLRWGNWSATIVPGSRVGEESCT